MFRIGNMNKIMPENRTSVLFGENIDEKTQCKNLNKSSRKGRAEKSCKLPCKGKTNKHRFVVVVVVNIVVVVVFVVVVVVVVVNVVVVALLVVTDHIISSCGQ